MPFVAPDPDAPKGGASTGPFVAGAVLAPEAIAHWAFTALIREVDLTPKPGLVDRRNSGAHRDMDYGTFLASAAAIAPFFPEFFTIGAAHADDLALNILPAIRPTGIACEKAMFAATGNVNTHKGAIFSLGLFCAAAGRLSGRKQSLSRLALCAEVATMSAGLLDELTQTEVPKTVGEKLFCRYGLTGIRGEAASGYATVRDHALPVFDKLTAEGFSEETVLLQCLLSLLAHNDDSNLFGRGGLDGMAHVRAKASELLQTGGVLAPDGLDQMARFDEDLIARNLSPGGSADLLAVTWFLSRFPQ